MVATLHTQWSSKAAESGTNDPRCYSEQPVHSLNPSMSGSKVFNSQEVL